MKTHAFIVVAFAFRAAGPAAAQRDAGADRLCEPGSHVEQRACLTAEAHKSELRLAKAETDARSALVTVDQNERREHCALSRGEAGVFSGCRHLAGALCSNHTAV